MFYQNATASNASRAAVAVRVPKPENTALLVDERQHALTSEAWRKLVEIWGHSSSKELSGVKLVKGVKVKIQLTEAVLPVPQHIDTPVAKRDMTLTKIAFGTNLPGFQGGPQGRPGVIVIQEWWGVTDSVKQQAEIVAERGNYRVLIPDLYKGKIGVTAEEGHHLMENLNWPNALTELKQAVQHLRSDGSSKVGAVGFCMGGALSLLAAEHAGVDAAVSFYGKPDPRMGTPGNITVPIQAHSGSNDAFKGFADPATVKPWVEKVPNGKGAFFEYPGEGHGFMNAEEGIQKTMKQSGMPLGKKESQDKAWERVLEFFKDILG